MNKDNEINILISVNSKYIEKACTMLFSLYVHNSNPIHVYLLNSTLSNDELWIFNEKLKKYNIKLTIIDTNSIHVFDKMTIGESHFSKEMYFRIIAHLLLPKNMNRIMWLDSDIIINGSIEELYFTDITNVPLVAACDSNNTSPIILKCKKNIGLKDSDQYFNSGVLLINLQYMRNNIDLETIGNVCEKLKNKLMFPDQDILNYIFSENKKIVDWRVYNYQVCGGIGVDYDECAKARIIHYTSEKKPWDYKYQNDFCKFYWDIRIKEGFENEYIKTAKKNKLFVFFRLNYIYEKIKSIKFKYKKLINIVKSNLR